MPESIPDTRLAAAKQLTALLEANPSFSFIRLGDGETWWLMHVQNGKPPPKYRYQEDKGASCECARSVSGLEIRHLGRFVEALEESTFLDYCDSIQTVRDHLPYIRFDRRPQLYRNSSPETSNIIFEWVQFEFRDYLAKHRCLIATAESALLEELYSDSQYLDIAREYWPCSAEIYFHQVRDNGRRYSENLDLIKEELRREIQANNVDTLFLSLATGAKILCYELAREMNIRAVDFGSMARALAYAGSPGYQSNRNLHNPFTVRVPLNIFLSALERANPEMAIAEITSRAHAQIILDLQDLKPMRFNTTDAITGIRKFSKTNVRNFKESLDYYRKHYLPRVQLDAEAMKLHEDFEYWCLKNGPQFKAKVFRVAVRLKAGVRSKLERIGQS